MDQKFSLELVRLKKNRKLLNKLYSEDLVRGKGLDNRYSRRDI